MFASQGNDGLFAHGVFLIKGCLQSGDAVGKYLKGYIVIENEAAENV